MPYTRGFFNMRTKRYVYPSQVQASLTLVTVPNTTSAFKLFFKEVTNCKNHTPPCTLWEESQQQQHHSLAQRISHIRLAEIILQFLQWAILILTNPICRIQNIRLWHRKTLHIRSKRQGHSILEGRVNRCSDSACNILLVATKNHLSELMEKLYACKKTLQNFNQAMNNKTSSNRRRTSNTYERL
jgi:hypothetical protein